MVEEIKYALGGLFFTWDDEKAAANWRKHKVTFELAAEVFFDENAMDLPDELHDGLETRRRIMGFIADFSKTLFVVYVEREDWNGIELIRIISARLAERKEREAYERQLSKIPETTDFSDWKPVGEKFKEAAQRNLAVLNEKMRAG